MKADIVVIGSTNIDMVIKSEKFPRPGETIIGGEFYQTQGGKGANQAVAAARLGGSVNFITRVGDDDFGQKAVEQYKKEGIYTDNVIIDPKLHTGVALISVNSNGENKITVAPGANGGFTEDEIRACEKPISDADIILLQLEIPLNTVSRILKLAKRSKTKVILNPAPAYSLPEWFFKKLFLISPNKIEVEEITGILINGKKSNIEAAQKLKSFGVQNVIITLGKQGAFLFTEEYSGLIPAPRVQVNDTTAAGDVFNGALAVALTKQWGFEESVRFACDAAAISVTKKGAQISAPNLEELRLFRSNRNKKSP